MLENARGTYDLCQSSRQQHTGLLWITCLTQLGSVGSWKCLTLNSWDRFFSTFRQMYVIRNDRWTNDNHEDRFCHEASPFGHAAANADHEGSNHMQRFHGCRFFFFSHVDVTLQRPSPLVLLHLDCVCGAQDVGSRNFLSACHGLPRVDLPHIHIKTRM